MSLNPSCSKCGATMYARWVDGIPLWLCTVCKATKVIGGDHEVS